MSEFSWGCKRHAYAILKAMRQGSKQGASSISHSGYTIIEVMIFLVVTGTLLISAMAIFNGRQVRTEYVQSIRETDQRILTVANEVATGYFPEKESFACTSSTTSTNISPVNSERQGGNEDCVFLGKIVQFGVDGDQRQYVVHTVAGSRKTPDSSQIVTTLQEARPNTVDALLEDFRIPYGGQAYRVRAQACGGTDIAGFAIYQSLGGVSGGDPISGSQTTKLYPLCATDFGDSVGDVQSAARSVNTYQNFANPQDGVVVCFGGPNSQTSSVRIGGRGSALTTDVGIDSNVAGECS